MNEAIVHTDDEELEVIVVHQFKIIDRIARDWPSSPLWDDEPDKVQYQVGKYAALAVRNHMGAWCGYVGVPEGHPLYGQDYSDEAPF